MNDIFAEHGFEVLDIGDAFGDVFESDHTDLVFDPFGQVLFCCFDHSGEGIFGEARNFSEL